MAASSDFCLKSRMVLWYSSVSQGTDSMTLQRYSTVVCAIMLVNSSMQLVCCNADEYCSKRLSWRVFSIV